MSKYVTQEKFLLCSWQIRADDGYVIRVKVKTLDLGSCDECGNLQMFDGLKELSSNKLGEWTKEKPDLVSSGNLVLIKFKTNKFAETKGLEISYEKIRIFNRMLMCNSIDLLIYFNDGRFEIT